MAIVLGDNIRIGAGKPADAKYLSSANIPYASISAVNTAIPIPERHVGLTVNIMGVEYWYTGVTTSPIPKTTNASGGTSANAITGATNIGFFQGYSGVQTIAINKTGTGYDGNYYSLYNYYYRGTDGRVHIGTPTDGIPKRGYYNPVEDKSWIWNEFTGDGLYGWIFMWGNISNKIGVFDNGYTYYDGSTTFPYTVTSWIQPTPSNGSDVLIDLVSGSLTTGATITIGGGVFAKKVGHVLEFKTIETKTPETIGISTDEAFVYISGKTQTGRNLGTGANVYGGNTGTTLQFRSLVGGGATTVNQVGTEIVISSSGGTGGGVYNLSSPAAITVGGIIAGTPSAVLTGKTAFELFETMLVPELFGAFTDRSVSISTNAFLLSPYYEIGCVASFNICGTFNRGSIIPSYWTEGTYSTSSTFRVGVSSSYTFTGGGGVAGTYPSITSPMVRPATSVVIAPSQSWSVQVAYNDGNQPMSSKNNPFGTKCLASTVGPVSLSINGILPYYYGKLTSGSRPPVTNNLVTGGTKCVLPSGSDIWINDFNAGSSDYTWVAIPDSSPTRKSWFIDITNKGGVNQLPTDKYPDECFITISSGQGCWSGELYRVYMSKTIGTINVPIQFRTTTI